MKRLLLLLAAVVGGGAQPGTPLQVDLLLRGGETLDGGGGPAKRADVGIAGDTIVFVGDAEAAGVLAKQSIDVSGLTVTPGFIDMHSHAELDEDFGRDARSFLYQGITTAVLGVDGDGPVEISDRLRGWARSGIGVNALLYVGHGTVRRAVLGMRDRAPTTEELERMKTLVRQGMEEGAFGFSTGLFYSPGSFSTTEEVIELARAAAPYGGIYDTHDRDLGASYQGIGYLNSTREAIRIGEESGCRVIFSHFNAQGAHNYGRAKEGAALVEAARARGVEVAAAQHVYTATQSSLQAYAIPRWAVAGGREAMLGRFDDPETVRELDRQTMEMLEIRGGAGKILFVDPRPELNGRTLAEISKAWALPVPETVRRVLKEDNAAVMNLDLYDVENTRYLATRDWMMTCTDGRPPSPEQNITHPRAFGAFTKKLRQFVFEEKLISLPFAIRSMTGLAADFLRLPDRGYLKVGMKADIAVFDPARLNDPATYENPRQYAQGMVHLLVNGRFAIRDAEIVSGAWGRPLRRGGAEAK